MSNMHKGFTNTITGTQYVQPKPNNNEKHYDGSAMITETDPSGIITYANRKFLEFTGFERKELIGMCQVSPRYTIAKAISRNTLGKILNISGFV